MTVLIGVLCENGVVIGADSSATSYFPMGSSGQVRTIEQYYEKIEIIDDQVILAGTGSMGLGQRFYEVVKNSWRGGEFKKLNSAVDYGKRLSVLGINDFQETGLKVGNYGALAAFPTKGTPTLCELSLSDFQPELKTNRLWYVAMGGGQPIADPFLGFIREIFWEEGAPSRQEGVFAVTWVLEHVIDLKPGGVKGPPHIATLFPNSKGIHEARLLSPEEISEHQQSVADAKEHLRGFRENISGKSEAQDIPKP